MHKQVLIGAIIVLFAATGAVNAAEPRDFSQNPVRVVQLPGTQAKIAFNTPELQVGDRRPMEPLIGDIMAWLFANLDLPAVQDQPHVKFIDASPTTRYNSASKTIYLPDNWTGATPTELSMLVPEIVRHVQAVAGLEYGCPEARADIAVTAQQNWLAIFALDIQRQAGLNTKVAAVGARCALLR